MAARFVPTLPFPRLLRSHLARVLGPATALALLGAAAGCNETTEACVFDLSDAEVELADLADAWYCKGGARYAAREVTGDTRFDSDRRCAEALFSVEPAPGAPCAIEPGIPFAVEGRPLTVDGEARVAPTERGDGWVVQGAGAISGLTRREREFLVGRWADAAAYEHASVASFARFLLDLLRFGAPAELVAGAAQAAADEVRHAQAAFSLASRFGGESLAPGALVLPDALPLSPDLAAFARATLLEGCVGETLAALRAAERCAVAEDAAVIEALQALVREESAHAELAWRTVEWALEVGGDPVREALRAAAEEARDLVEVQESVPEDVDPSVLLAFGVLSAAREEAALLRAWNGVIAPALGALLG